MAAAGDLKRGIVVQVDLEDRGGAFEDARQRGCIVVLEPQVDAEARAQRCC